MDERDLAILELAGERFKFEGNRLNVARERFGLSGPQFWQAVLTLADSPAAELARPEITHRLRRLREQRARYGRRLTS